MITERSRNFVKEVPVPGDSERKTIEINKDTIKRTIESEISGFSELSEKLRGDEKKAFDETIKRCKENEIMFEAKSRQIKEELGLEKVTAKMEDEGSTNAEKPKFSNYMNYIAGTTLVVIGALMILSIGCVEWKLCTVDSNPYIQILESNFLMVLVGTVVGPIVSKYLKEKYDIQIKAEQISMITQDAVKTVSMYNKAANELRDDDGKLPEGEKKKLQDLALTSIKANFGDEKFKELLTSLSGQAFKKAIDYAVAQKYIESFPLEQKQVEKIIKQSIDAVPYIVNWQDKDPKVKETFIRGYVKGLLQNTGANGWAYHALEGVFDAEVNKRIAAAAVADAKGMLNSNEKDPMKKYSSIIADSILDAGIK